MIPPLVSYTTIDRFLEDLEEAMRRVRTKYPQAIRSPATGLREQAEILWANGLPPIVSRRAFSLLFGVSPRLVPRMMAAPEIYWRKFQIPKRSGGLRTIDTPRAFLKTFQLYILQNVLSMKEVSANAYGFSKGRGCKAHATQHVGKPYVFNTDIKDFFPSIKFPAVLALFRSFGYNDETAMMLASLCTLGGTLPQGAPTSPRIADLVFEPVDILLSAIAREAGATYTRYADDLTFSSDKKLPTGLLTSMVGALDRFGFRINHEKTRMSGPGMRRRVTGFVVNQKVHPDRETRRSLRAKFHKLSLEAPSRIEEINNAQGWASYVNSYDQQLGGRYLEAVRMARATWRQKAEIGAAIASTGESGF